MEDKVFKFNISQSWDVAFHHGHSAFHLLSTVCDIENEYIEKKASLDGLVYGHAEYLMVLPALSNLTTSMFRVSAASIMMFQAMMEALINDVLSRESVLVGISKTGSFHDKWSKSLSILDQDNSSFVEYKNDIYTKYRNPLVHPKKLKPGTFDEVSFRRLYNGFYAGWDAYKKLSEGIKRPHSDRSWEVMCEGYKLPTTKDAF